VDLRRARHRGARPFLPESFNAAGAKHLLLKATAASATSPIW
jgi:hypothetical protein